MTQEILTHRFDNGLSLVAEPMDWLQSAAFNLLVPAGCSRDPAKMVGLSNFTCEMVQRGGGARNHRQTVEALENLGVDYGASVSNVHASFGAAMPASNLREVLAIFADLTRQPHLPANELEDGRLVCLQEIYAMEDELAQRTINELRARQYPDPLGRACHGNVDSINSIQLKHIRRHFDATYRPNQAILAVAGNFDWDQLRDSVAKLFGDWTSRELPEIRATPALRGRFHIPHDSNQTHIAIAYPNAPYSHPDYFQARGAVGVLSDGMSSRLFFEVREKRGLCYTVSASCHSLIDQGCVICYAGSRKERAQETLDVIITELKRLAQGIQADELDRLKVQVRSGLIMQQESSRARAAAIAADWYYLQRVRSLDEINRIVNGLTVESINNYLAANPPSDFCIVTLGEKELEAPDGVS